MHKDNFKDGKLQDTEWQVDINIKRKKGMIIKKYILKGRYVWNRKIKHHASSNLVILYKLLKMMNYRIICKCFKNFKQVK